MPNQLSGETSPYLRQHQENPVDWYPWGQTALKKAQIEEKPIFLSIGYAACHWCHVMAHESFEDPVTARLLNEHFISIKVDREERPDLDDIYMQAVVALTGQGGWPLSVFLTPDRRPFYGGTYFPPQPRYGMPSFQQILQAVIEVWQNRREDAMQNAGILTRAIQNQSLAAQESGTPFDPSRIIKVLKQQYDGQHGGWGGAPKFPQPMVIEFLIQNAAVGNELAQKMAFHTLHQMAKGGLYDLAGGGFHRYSTDAHWLVPHFEKMLYDNAQLSLAYLHAYSLTGEKTFQHVTEQTLDFLLREMRDPKGGFYASLDADSPGGEGRFYTWTLNELRSNLTSHQWRLLQDTMNLTENGNFEDGRNLLQLRQPLPELAGELGKSPEALQSTLSESMAQLMAVRKNRERPDTDNKIITAWNALAIRAFAEAGVLLNNPTYLEAAKEAADFIIGNLMEEKGRLKRSWSQEKASQPGTLADHALMALALAALYQADFDAKWIPTLRQFLDVIEKDFSSDGPLYYDASVNVQDLILRPRSLQDNATPSGNAAAALALLISGHLDEDPVLLTKADAMIRKVIQTISDHPTHFGLWLQTANLQEHGLREIALVSQLDMTALKPYLAFLQSKYRPYDIVAVKNSTMDARGNMPGLVKNKTAVEDYPTAYVCENFSCRSPVTNLESLEQVLSQDRGSTEKHQPNN